MCQRRLVIIIYSFILFTFILQCRGKGGTDVAASSLNVRADRREDGKRQVLASKGRGGGGAAGVEVARGFSSSPVGHRARARVCV